MYKYVELSIADTAEVPAVACYRLKDQVQGEGSRSVMGGGGGGKDYVSARTSRVRSPKSLTAGVQGGISSSVLSVFFTDKFALSQSDARISVAYNSCQ